MASSGSAFGAMTRVTVAGQRRRSIDAPRFFPCIGLCIRQVSARYAQGASGVEVCYGRIFSPPRIGLRIDEASRPSASCSGSHSADSAL